MPTLTQIAINPWVVDFFASGLPYLRPIRLEGKDRVGNRSYGLQQLFKFAKPSQLHDNVGHAEDGHEHGDDDAAHGNPQKCD